MRPAPTLTATVAFLEVGIAGHPVGAPHCGLGGHAPHSHRRRCADIDLFTTTIDTWQLQGEPTPNVADFSEKLARFDEGGQSVASDDAGTG
jgi:hypothetical protein